ncbi:hypothetical protein EUGRSUZ_G00229 [Eucalyptus grandis]|uniref:Uncharacterized protein n=2 Tax=Eucalyptus grandis TaxID=71139 RepID=A0ACC3JZC7_EUCGR|nr:hypothetical protein EUGRSUZ_G00229 [Eucalyptus grandis]
MIIPEDLLIEILKRLPVKSLCQFTCVSTRWSSLISDPYFIDLHLTHSATRPKLLVGFHDLDDECGGVFSVDQLEPHNGRTLIATLPFSFHGWTGPFVLQSQQGLVSLEVGGHIQITNPLTGMYATFGLPRITERYASFSYYQQMHSFGFDPVERKHKVLSTRVIIMGGLDGRLIMESWVLTLGTEKWRQVEGCAAHDKKGREVCFDGVVYYMAWSRLHGVHGDDYLVAFDVRTESFRMVTIPAEAHKDIHRALLIKFEKHVAMVDRNKALSCEEIIMWILEDFDQEIWKKRVFSLPSYWKEIVANRRVFPVGTVRSGELLFAPQTLLKPVCMRSEICGLDDVSPEFGVLTFLDHVESLLSPRAIPFEELSVDFPSKIH